MTAGVVTIRAALAGIAILMASTAAADPPSETQKAHLGAVMDSIFGSGRWRETGGYRTPQRENELRAQGALTVPAGVLSRHSVGGRDAPGAYDVVVDGVNPDQAAAKLRRAGAPFRTILAEGAHGTQGPHLHLEPTDPRAAARRPAGVEWVVKDPTPAEQAMIQLHDRSAKGEGDAQLRLGRIYAEGRAAPRDLIAAFVWTSLAASNGAAEPVTRSTAARLLAELAGTMRSADLRQARRFLNDPKDPDGCGTSDEDGPVLVIRPDGPRGSTISGRPQDGCASAAAALASP